MITASNKMRRTSRDYRKSTGPATQLVLLAVRARRLRRVAPFGLRVNPDVAAPTHRHIAAGRRGHKFGVAPAEAPALYRQYAGQRWVRATAASVHIGSQILDPAPFAAAVRRLGRFAAEVRAAGCALEALDIGGGLGIAYRPGERATPALLGLRRFGTEPDHDSEGQERRHTLDPTQ
jgi:diaminopimelate decarboxylase